MPVRETAVMGAPVLKLVAQPVADPTDPEIAQLATDMRETLESIDVTGLAAPQVFVSKRVVVYSIPAARIPSGATMDPIPWTTIVNPVLTPLTAEKRPMGLERCVSLPGLFGEVPRYTKVRVQAVGLDNRPIDIVATGYHARLMQHEIDHLDGILYPMRMTEMSTFGYTRTRDPDDFVLKDPGLFAG